MTVDDVSVSRRLPVTLDDFIRRYEQALASQQWANVDPLVHDDACVTFSDGAVHKGKPAVRTAFESNFAAIQDEQYRISNVHWVIRGGEAAVYLFDFQWTGCIDGREVGGGGRGTSVLIREGNGWKLLTEHLGPGPVEAINATEPFAGPEP